MNNDQLMDFVSDLNEKNILSSVSVPILDGFQLIPNEGTLFTAVSDENFIQQFLYDGILEDGEDFESRLDKVVEDTKKFMRESGLSDVEHNFHFFKKYKNSDFRFKIYIQDNILNEKIMRQFNIYFVDDDTREFFEVTFCCCPYSIDEEDYVREDLTMSMISTINNLMDNIKK